MKTFLKTLAAIIGLLTAIILLFAALIPLLREMRDIQAPITVVVTATAPIPSISNTPAPVIPSAIIESSPRPSGVALEAGEIFKPTAGWIWICTGDFEVTRSDQSSIQLYDSLEKTSSIILIEQDSLITIKAPYKGSCQPYLADEKESALSNTIQLMLADPQQCVSGCSSITVYILDNQGNIIDSYFRP